MGGLRLQSVPFILRPANVAYAPDQLEGLLYHSILNENQTKIDDQMRHISTVMV